MRKMLRGILLKLVYPALMVVAAITGGSSKERLQGFVIELNNKLIRGSGIRAKKLLLLLPHCLQIDQCEIRLTHNVRNCKLCGKCGMKDLINISDRYGLDIHVATGGNLARRIVGDLRPEAIVAVACERDLSSGIADVYPMIVYGVSNERPCGPCLNTQVDVTKIEAAIGVLAEGKGC